MKIKYEAFGKILVYSLLERVSTTCEKLSGYEQAVDNFGKPCLPHAGKM